MSQSSYHRTASNMPCIEYRMMRIRHRGRAGSCQSRIEVQDRQEAEEARRDSKAKAFKVLAKPVEWRGKAYHRAEQAGDEHARKSAEVREREKWASRVLGTLVTAKLPFGWRSRPKVGTTSGQRLADT